MADKLKDGQRITITLTGIVRYCSPGDRYVDLVTDDGRRHVIESPKLEDYRVVRTMYVGEVWRTSRGNLFFVRAWKGISAAHDNKKVIPAAAKGDTYDTGEFLQKFPDAECVFSP